MRREQSLSSVPVRRLSPTARPFSLTVATLGHSGSSTETRLVDRMLPRLLPRSLVRPSPRSTITLSSRTLMSSAPTLGPVEQAIRTRVRLWSGIRLAYATRTDDDRSPPTQLEEALQPTTLDITNDSSKHRHHAPMKAIGGGDGETHFTVSVVSERFEGMVRSLPPLLSALSGACADSFSTDEYSASSSVTASSTTPSSLSLTQGCTRSRSGQSHQRRSRSGRRGRRPQRARVCNNRSTNIHLHGQGGSSEGATACHGEGTWEGRAT